jgi:hypothetical protein
MFTPVMNVVRSLWQVPKMGSIVPPANQVSIRVTPMEAISDDLDLPSFLAHILGEFQLLAIP